MKKQPNLLYHTQAFLCKFCFVMMQKRFASRGRDSDDDDSTFQGDNHSGLLLHTSSHNPFAFLLSSSPNIKKMNTTLAQSNDNGGWKFTRLQKLWHGRTNKVKYWLYRSFFVCLKLKETGT